MTLTIEAAIGLDPSDPRIEALCDHLVAHGIGRADAGGETRLTFPHFPGAEVRLSRLRAGLRLCITAHDTRAFDALRQAVSASVLQVSGVPVHWSQGEQMPGLRTLRLAAAQEVSPTLRRLTFSTGDAARFARLDALHLKMLLPDPARPGETVLRKYTVRAVDVAAGRLAIDFVLHRDAGPGAEFARRARIGDAVDVIGPGGGGLARADWYLFAGDDTALPAIARMLEALPGVARGVALLAAEPVALCAPPGVAIRWLRGGLPDAVRAVEIPATGRRYVWAGCEYAPFRAIRADLRGRGLAPDEHLIVSYWRCGVPQS
ncbi:siderophore-interacting protein [Paenirhodobacter sp.]|uniref:siderophore-interacting protein n=1 Tax=Paenirhodobacter sp. TaxID=1965326 RepID=UPI003B3E98EE